MTTKPTYEPGRTGLLLVDPYILLNKENNHAILTTAELVSALQAGPRAAD
jgi:hypothetical protein